MSYLKTCQHDWADMSEPCPHCPNYTFPVGTIDFTSYVDTPGYMSINPELEQMIRENNSTLKEVLNYLDKITGVSSFERGKKNE